MLFIMTGIEKTIDKILENKYKDSLKILRMSKTSQGLLEELKKECPNAPEKEIVSLFKSVAAGTKMVDSAIVAAAHNLEYNVTHPSKPEGTWLDVLFTDEAKKIMTPKELMSHKKLYREFIAYLTKLEEKYDDADPPDIAILKRRVTTFLKEHAKAVEKPKKGKKKSVSAKKAKEGKGKVKKETVKKKEQPKKPPKKKTAKQKPKAKPKKKTG